MRCIVSPFKSCYQNIASEEYFLDHFDDTFYLYINSPCIIVGKYQNTYAEINHEFVKEHGIDVVRRNSGGGSVYHDYGNLNYGFIIKDEQKGTDEIFRSFTAPIIEVLGELGADAVFSGRNDISIGGKKVSGNAQYRANGKVLMHGTLLFCSDLFNVGASLNPDKRKFLGKGIDSVMSRVTNILPNLSTQISIDEFSNSIISKVFSRFENAYMYKLSANDRVQIELLAAKKYASWDWVFGSCPEFTYVHTLRLADGIIDVCVLVQSGVISDIKLRGDFFCKKDPDEALAKLKDVKFDESSIAHAIENIRFSRYIPQLTGRMLLDCLFSPSEKSSPETSRSS